MSKVLDELTKAYADASKANNKARTVGYEEEGELAKKHREEKDALIETHKNKINELRKKQQEDRKDLADKVDETRKSLDARYRLETETKKIFNSLISGLANAEYDTAKVMEQAEAEATLLIQ